MDFDNLRKLIFVFSWERFNGNPFGREEARRRGVSLGVLLVDLEASTK